MRGAWLHEADLSYADLYGAYLSWVSFKEANLQEAKLFGAYLKGTDLRKANFSWKDIRAEVVEMSVSPPRASRVGANLSGANLSGASLSRANLHHADLSWTNLSKADFRKTDLTGAYVYAISAWDFRLEGTRQSNLLIKNPTN